MDGWPWRAGLTCPAPAGRQHSSRGEQEAAEGSCSWRSVAQQRSCPPASPALWERLSTPRAALWPAARACAGHVGGSRFIRLVLGARTWQGSCVKSPPTISPSPGTHPYSLCVVIPRVVVQVELFNTLACSRQQVASGWRRGTSHQPAAARAAARKSWPTSPWQRGRQHGHPRPPARGSAGGSGGTSHQPAAARAAAGAPLRSPRQRGHPCAARRRARPLTHVPVGCLQDAQQLLGLGGRQLAGEGGQATQELRAGTGRVSRGAPGERGG